MRKSRTKGILSTKIDQKLGKVESWGSARGDRLKVQREGGRKRRIRREEILVKRKERTSGKQKRIMEKIQKL